MKKRKLKSKHVHLFEHTMKRGANFLVGILVVASAGVWVLSAMHFTAAKTSEIDSIFHQNEVLSARDGKNTQTFHSPTDQKSIEPLSKPNNEVVPQENSVDDNLNNLQDQSNVVMESVSQQFKNPETQNSLLNADKSNKTKADLPKDLTFDQMLVRSQITKIIVVNLTEQNLKTLEKGEVKMDTKITSGRKSFDTPVGQFLVVNKAKDVRLRAPSPRFGDYDLPAQFWLGFGNGYGFHDATWRKSFGGPDYAFNGSHGCINMPTEAVKSLYSWADIGTEVYIIN